MIKTLKLTSTEVTVWLRTLRAFETWVVLRAIISVGYSRKAFVSLGDVACKCRDIEVEYLRYGVASFPAWLRRFGDQFGAMIDPPLKPEKPKAIGQRTTGKTKTAVSNLAARFRQKRNEHLAASRPAASEAEPLPGTADRLSPEARDQLTQAMNTAAAKRRRIR